MGDALERFQRALGTFRVELRKVDSLYDAVFSGAEDWIGLLDYKLVPHMAGDGCLVAAVAGGTNTGKSTVFNLLLGREVSPVASTAAATCHPVLAASRRRYDECLESKLVPEFQPLALERPEDVTTRDAPKDALFVVLAEDLPDKLVIMDTPDVDSIDKQNWEVADHIRAAGDVIIAVLTAEKYRDARVIDFFRQAQSSGRVVLPLMNKANPENGFDVARKQIDEFRKDVETDEPGFVVAHDFEIGKATNQPIESLKGSEDLRAYLGTIDVHAVKRRVLHDSMAHFGARAGEFLANAAKVGDDLRAIADDFERRAHTHVMDFDPTPGAEVGGLFHDFVQSKRGPIRRYIGAASKSFVRGASVVSKAVVGAFRSTASLEAAETVTPQEQYETQKRAIDRIVREIVSDYIDTARNLREPAGALLTHAFDDFDPETVIPKITDSVLSGEDISEAFRDHATRTLEIWWDDHKGKRRILESLDIILAIIPAAIAAPIAMYTGGVGASEAAIAAGPFVAQFVTRVMELQFGDAMFDFLSPWKEERQRKLEEAVRAHVTQPTLAGLYGLLEPFEGELFNELKVCHELCLKALPTYSKD